MLMENFGGVTEMYYGIEETVNWIQMVTIVTSRKWPLDVTTAVLSLIWCIRFSLCSLYFLSFLSGAKFMSNGLINVCITWLADLEYT